ncbi:hypothetical protein CYL77_09265 [Corynebacterium glutamicum]|uniref:Hypothetical membrane protein n=1 Tax=Corynebacterium glutamicum (strain ATCC 13032 / DSM 20300 / JCM 1318 / BCRC 11384 / CCUG 27702 / LMG 3730 / NBRC 12168 / NCIMB 10025 / NRRL B-2784 / 534) TaxID=196627 RepID=Q8NPH9_CORGL|nr:hypothetical protein B7P23_03715 [Corynebacterium glutamicum]CAF20213.1 putative membrane protein [Corynebacterium glutamicum ATCC 13032]CCH24978.1 hypothetical membrane protein [Corynebacterium glutamicum K051]AUI01313.1 hypothetical protein CYL77_09265 [Corynebacterium glutamicum]AUI04963.1 hypothetical protein C0I99_12960 [Corynebacterium glutamicum]
MITYFSAIDILSLLILSVIMLICSAPVLLVIFRSNSPDDLIAALILTALLGFLAVNFVLPTLADIGCTLCEL